MQASSWPPCPGFSRFPGFFFIPETVIEKCCLLAKLFHPLFINNIFSIVSTRLRACHLSVTHLDIRYIFGDTKPGIGMCRRSSPHQFAFRGGRASRPCPVNELANHGVVRFRHGKRIPHNTGFRFPGRLVEHHVRLGASVGRAPLLSLPGLGEGRCTYYASTKSRKFTSIF